MTGRVGWQVHSLDPVLEHAHLYLRLADRVVGGAPRDDGNPNHQGPCPMTPRSAIASTGEAGQRHLANANAK